MRDSLVFGGVCLMLLTAAASGPQGYTLDPQASEVTAKVAFFAIASKTAGFPKVSGTATIADRKPETLTLDVKIDARALTAPDEVTLGRLRGEKFFWVEKFPEIRFRGTQMRMTGADKGAIEGQLTARGVTRPVTLSVSFAQPPVSTPLDRPIDIVGTTEINRRDFGMTAYALIVGKTVHITIRARMMPE